MSVVTPDQVRALVDTELSDTDLQDVIDRDEAALARVIGPLAGERTQTFYPDDRPDTHPLPLILLRPTDAVAVVDQGTVLAPGEFRLYQNGYVLERVPADAWWGGPVAATYEPNDLLEVQRVIIELSRLTITETGYLSETIGEYTYSRGARGGARNPTESARNTLIRRLLPPTLPSTSRTATARPATWGRPWIANWNDPHA